MSGGSCWSQQNSMDINECRRPSEDALPMYHHLHAIFKEHQIMTPIKEISSTNQQQNISGQVLADEITNQVGNDSVSEDLNITENLHMSNTPTETVASGVIMHQYQKDAPVYNTERANSSACLFTQSKVKDNPPSTRYRSSIATVKTSTSGNDGYLPPSTKVPASSGSCITKNASASSRRNQWKRRRPMSLDTVLMKKKGSKTILEAASSHAITNHDQW